MGMGTMHGYAVRIRVLHVKKSRVQVRDHGYCNNFRIRISMGMDMGKGTTSLLS